MFTGIPVQFVPTLNKFLSAHKRSSLLLPRNFRQTPSAYKKVMLNAQKRDNKIFIWFIQQTFDLRQDSSPPSPARPPGLKRSRTTRYNTTQYLTAHHYTVKGELDSNAGVRKILNCVRE
ncbi:unnamed protein product [Nesidiocoris tenuis]|uniref:Uncharacterized protein n=1 Tax=Nesidiocoris tenuis TaxID=355587 RepID=A0A6H5HE32_9HEMI|nr:unnamed protein product [Nesidiocoris tenuis]